MLALRNPHEAYRKVDFDARISSAGPRELVLLCFEQFDLALGRALHAKRLGDNRAKSEALTRALSAVTALQIGIADGMEATPALRRFYEAARRVLLDCVITFDSPRLVVLRQDFSDVAGALSGR